MQHPEELPLIQEAVWNRTDLEKSEGAGCDAFKMVRTMTNLREVAWRAFIIMVALFVCASAIHRISPFATGTSSSYAVVHELALLSAHVGPKFIGLQSFFASNKFNFATQNNASLYLAEDVFRDPAFKGILPPEMLEDGQLAQNQFRIKIELALAVFAKSGQQTKWAVWVDGDTWLAERAVDLVSKLKLSQDNPVDLIIGTEKQGLNVSKELPPCMGINAGVFAIRNSPSAIAFLHQLLAIPPAEYGIVKDHFDDQCAIQEMWKRDASWLKVASVLSSEDTGKLLQCRSHAKCTKYFPDLCCTADSWSVHWPASDWHDLVERLVEKEVGSEVLTDLSHSVEVEACQAIQSLEGRPVPACRNVHAGL